MLPGMPGSLLSFSLRVDARIRPVAALAGAAQIELFPTDLTQ